MATSKLDSTFVMATNDNCDDDSTQDLFGDTTNTSSQDDSAQQQQQVRQPHKFRKSGERTREAVRDENSSASDLSVEGVAKPMRKRKLGKKTSAFFNPV